MTVTLPLPFRASRFLEPGNALLGVPGVALELVGIGAQQPILDGWRRRVVRVAAHLDWPRPRTATFRAGDRRVLTFAAPIHQLQTAREANEWALCACVARRDPCHWGALCEALRVARADDGAHQRRSAPASQQQSTNGLRWRACGRLRASKRRHLRRRREPAVPGASARAPRAFPTLVCRGLEARAPQCHAVQPRLLAAAGLDDDATLGQRRQDLG